MEGESSLKYLFAFLVSAALFFYSFVPVAFATCYDSDGNTLSFANMDDYLQFVYYCRDNNIIDLTSERCIIYRGMYSSELTQVGQQRYYYGYVTFAEDATYASVVSYTDPNGNVRPQIITDGTILSNRFAGRIAWPFLRGSSTFSVGSWGNLHSSDIINYQTLPDDFEICASNLMDFTNDGTIPQRVWDCPLTASLAGDEYGFDILVHAKDVEHEVAINSFQDPSNIPYYQVIWEFEDITFFNETSQLNNYSPASYPLFDYAGNKIGRGSNFHAFAFSLDYISSHGIVFHVSKYLMSQPLFNVGAFLLGHDYRINFWCVAPDSYGYSVKFCTIDFTLGDNYTINGVTTSSNISVEDPPSLDPTYTDEVIYDFDRAGNYNIDDPHLEDFEFEAEFDDDLVQSTGFIKALFDSFLERAGLNGFYIAVIAISVGAWFLYGRFKGG